MPVQARYQATTQVTGSGYGAGGLPLLEDTEASTPVNTSAPPPGAYQLQNGNNTIVIPSGGGVVVNRVQLLPPTGSTISKTVKGVGGDSNTFTGWTVGSITLPCSAGTTFVIVSNGIEILGAAYS